MRVMCAACLAFEAVVVLLGITPAVVLTDLPAGAVVAVGFALFVLAVAVAGSLRRPGGYAAGFVVQGLVLATGFALTPMFLVGALFAAIWVAAYLLGRRMEADRARWAGQAAAGAVAGPPAPDRDGRGGTTRQP